MQIDVRIEIKPGEIRCPRCYSKDIALSRPRGWFDDLMRCWRRIPKHCRACGRRFFIRAESAAGQTAD